VLIKPLQLLVYTSCRLPAINTLGKSYYERVSSLTARAFSAVESVQSIRIFGGSVDRCVPGVSDLDLLLFIDEDSFSASTVSTLSGIYKSLKRRYPILGEVHLTSAKIWDSFTQTSPAELLWLSQQRIWTKGTWVPALASFTESVTSESRLALCLNHYFRALRWAKPRAGNSRSIARAHFLREVSKSIDLSAGEKVRLRSGIPPARLLTEAFLAHHRIDFGEGNERSSHFEEVEFGDDPGMRFTHELVEREWRRVIRKTDLAKFPLELGSIPHTWIWKGDLKEEELTPFFETYLRVVSNLEKTEAPVPLSALSHDTYLSGWAWGQLFSSWSWIPLPLRSETEWRANFLRNISEAYFERAQTQMFFLPGKFLSEKTSSLIHSLREMSHLALCFEQRMLHKEVAALRSLGSSQLEAANQILNVTGKKHELRRERVIEMGLALLSELHDFYSGFHRPAS
jgi:hypothetical protein